MAAPSVSTPRQLTGLAALRFGWQLARDQLIATQSLHEAHGPFVVVNALPFARPRTLLLGVPLMLTAGAAFNREALNLAALRPVSLLPGGPRNSAARRLSENLTRMTGRRHAHYRKLLTPALRKTTVDAMGDEMLALSEEELASWPTGEPVDLVELMHRLVRRISVELLFGGDRTRGYPIADMALHLTVQKWAPGVISFPVNLPITPYGRSVREAATLEREVTAWADSKRGAIDARDLVSILVNSPDADGQPVASASIARSVPALVAMTAEACQTTLIWILVLLNQHPQVARDLLDELNAASPSVDALMRLPRLEAVIKETMRIIPPVPVQMRVAEEETTLAGYPMPRRTRLILNAFLTNRAGHLYPQADRFLPERWSTIDPNAYEYLTFGAGPRQCPGYVFGMNLMKLALAAILKRFRVALAPGARIDYRVQPTLRPAGAVLATLHAQDGALSVAPITGSIGDLVRLPS